MHNLLSNLNIILHNINDNPRRTKPKWAIKRHTTDRFRLFDPHRISSLSTTAPDDFDNSPLGHSTTHAVKMRYIHSEERLPIPENGEHSTCPCSVFGGRPGFESSIISESFGYRIMSKPVRRIIIEGALIEDLEANSISVV